jgi:hypothetical protein
MNPLSIKLIILVLAAAGIAWPPGGLRAQETQRQKQEQTNQQNQYRDQEQSLQRDQAQRNVQAYLGQISSKHGNYYLENTHSRTSYLLADTWEGKKFVSKKVRVTGWLDTDKEILHVVSMATIP